MELIGNIIYLLFMHFIADFVFQTKEQQNNKYCSFEHLLYHIINYTGIMLFSYFIINLKIEYFSIFISIQFISHLLIDFISSKITHKLYNMGDYHNFFVVIGFDQWLHISILIFTYCLCL